MYGAGVEDDDIQVENNQVEVIAFPPSDPSMIKLPSKYQKGVIFN